MDLDGVNLKNLYFLEILDGHNNLVTPVPIPNTEVKLVMFMSVLSLMGKHGAVYLYSIIISIAIIFIKTNYNYFYGRKEKN